MSYETQGDTVEEKPIETTCGSVSEPANNDRKLRSTLTEYDDFEGQENSAQSKPNDIQKDPNDSCSNT